jgi:hypothetical protein
MGRMAQVIVALLYVLVAGYDCIDVIHNPYLNWDIIPYTALAMHIGVPDIHKVYAQVMQLSAWDPLSGNITLVQNHTRYYLLESAETFRQLLVWYVVKPVYVWLLYGAHLFGVPWTGASTVIGGISYVTAAAAIVWWTPSRALMPWWLAVLILWLPFSALDTVSRFATPDALATGLVLAALALGFVRATLTGMVCASLFALYTRPDLLPLLLLLMMVMGVMRHRMTVRQLVPVLLLLVAMAGFLYHITGYYGWQAHIHYQFFQRTAYPEAASIPFSQLGWNAYSAVLISGADTLLHTDIVLLSALLTVLMLVVWAGKRSDRLLCETGLLLLAGWGAFICRVVIFPDPAIRFYILYMVVIQLLALRAMVHVAGQRYADALSAQQ